LAAKHGLAEHVWAVEAVPGMAKMAKQLVCHGEAGFGWRKHEDITKK
jgi:hypothetical protein